MLKDLSFELFIAVRYLLAKRRQAFISVISLFSTIGVLVGVMAVLIALALMTGLQGELRDRIVGSSAQVYVSKIPPEGIRDEHAEIRKLKTIPHIVGVAPAVIGIGILTSDQDLTVPVTVKGIDPTLEPAVTEIRTAMHSGTLDAVHSVQDERDGIVLGVGLAKSLDVQVGDVVRLITPHQILTPMGVTQQMRTFTVVGTFSLGLYEFDQQYGLVDLQVAEHVFGKDKPDFMQVRVDDIFASSQVAENIRKQLGDEYITQDWREMNQSLFSALWLEKMAIAITIGLIIMVAALNIVASLVLLVMEKNRDIAILKTMGTRAASIRRIFILQGAIIGVVGTGGGTLAGIALILIVDRYKLIHVPIDVYQISYVPFKLLSSDLFTVVAAAMAICLVATLYPSRQAARLDPAEALRNQ